MSVFEWIRDVRQFGWGSGTTRDLRGLLQPKVKFSRSIHWPDRNEGADLQHEPRIKDIVDWDIVLRSGQDVSYHLDQMRRLEGWRDGLVAMLPDLTSLLKDAMDLMAELDGASEQYDLSYIHQPSISDHPQNQHFKDWTILIDLCRDAWAETAQRDARAAAAEFNRWRDIKYPVFKRLCLFAARIAESVVSPSDALELLSQDRSWWLWSVESQREAMRLICALATRLSVEEADRLTQLVLRGHLVKCFGRILTRCSGSASANGQFGCGSPSSSVVRDISTNRRIYGTPLHLQRTQNSFAIRRTR